MSRARLLRLVVTVAAAAALVGLAPTGSPANADPDPTAVPVTVLGLMSYDYDASLYWTRDLGTLPPGVSASGTPSCSRLATGAPTLSAHDTPGYSDLDPTSCSGVTLSGPNAASYHVTYPSPRLYVAAADVTVTLTPPSPTVALLSGKARFVVKVHARSSAMVAAGVPFHVGTGGRFYQILCSGVTDATGTGVCTGKGALYATLVRSSQGRLVYADTDLTPKWYWGSGWTAAPLF